MSAIPNSALDIKRRIAAGEPCPICDGTPHADGCLYAEYEHLRLRSTAEINRLSKLLRECQARCDEAEAAAIRALKREMRRAGLR